ncbi:BamA/TamA family outer membrane protein [Nonlabens antarcticus]|uniref:hypothetical protein n=1 Tax=Nonlabens antarcticus TaxID=392714 RepID=UPI001891E05E|nr:hypothetical protein [Nonlabens antarcticus]
MLKFSLVLIIYTLCFTSVFAQQWKLESTIYKEKDSRVAVDTILNLGTRKDVETASDSIRNKYLNAGYLNLTSKTDSVTFNSTWRQTIYLGRQYSTIEIIIARLDDYKTNGKSSLSRKRNRFIAPASLQEELSRLQKQLNDSGQPFAKIIPARWDFSSADTAKIFLEVFSEKSRKVDRIVVKGYPKYPKNLINNLVKGRPTYNSRNLNNIQSQLSSVNYIEVLKEPETLFKNDSTLLYIYIKKKSANAADGLIGFNTDKNGDLEINGYLEASFLNNFNYGEQINLEYRNDTDDQSRLNINASFPGLIRKKIGVSGGLEILRRDSLYQNTSLSIGLNYLLPRNSLLKITYENSSSTGTSNEFNDSNNPDYNTNGILVSYSVLKNSGDRLQPEDFSLTLEAGVQERALNESSDFQYQVGASLGKLWKLPYNFNLETNVNSYLLKTNNLQFNELKQVGGINTIRGFNQNNIDTAAYTFLQTELRYALNSQIYVNILSDAGVFERFTDRNPQYMYAFGGGFGILTGAGILKFQVANGYFLDRTDLKTSTIAHLNFVLSF